MARRTFDEIMQDRTTTRRKSFDDVLNSRRKSFDEIVPRRESVNTLEQMQDPAAVNAVEMIQKKSIEEKTKDDYNNLPEGAFEFVEANKKNNKISSLVDVASRNNNKFSILNKAASTTKSNISELLQTEYGMDKKRADYYENNWENISANKKSADFQKEMDDAISKMDSKQYELLKDYAQTSAIGFISPNGSSIAQKEMLQDRKNAKNRLMSEYGLTEEELAKLSDYVKRDSNKKYTEKLDEEAKEISKTGFGRGVLRAESLILSPVSGLSATIDNATQKITGRPIDIYSEGNLLHNMKTSAQSAVSESVGEKYGDKAQFINDVLMSTAESAETMLIGSGVASGLGLGGSIAEVAAKIASYPLFSSNAFASSFKEKKESGQNDDQAFAYAMASGISEGLFEELSFDRLQGILRSTGKVGVKEFIKNMLKQGLFEGTEEINTSIANTISDYLINADYSDYSMNKEAYMQNGYDEEEAGKMANKDLAKQLLYDGMAGAISGILMGGGASVVNYHNYKNMGSSASNETLKKATDTALASDIAKESTAREIAQKMSEEGRDVDSLTSKEKTQLFESLGSLQKEEINQAITDSLSSRVENADTMDKARALFREYYESDMTDEQFEQKLVNEVAKNSSERNAIQEAKKEVFGRESKVTPITQSLHNAGRDLQLDIHNKAIERQIAKQDKQAQKNFAKFENAVSSKEKYSKAKGVAAVSVKNGKETTDTKVLGIQRLGGENASLVVEGGKTVALKNVTFADQNFGKLYNEVSSVISSVEVANKALENYKGQPVESYVKAYDIAYELGRQSVRTNKNADWLLNNALDSYIIQNMGGAGVASEIFYNGQNDARKLASMKPKSENKSFKNKSNGEEILKGESEIKHLLAAISEKTGVKISEINAIKDNEGNYNTALLGSFFDNVITLNSEGKNEIQTLLHEVMEKMKSENQEGYNLIVSHVMDYVQSTKGSEALIDNLQKYQRAYAAVEGYSATEEIADEYTNDFVSGILTSKEGLQDLASWASTQNTNTAKNLFEAIRDFFSKILDEITRYMDSHKASMNPGTRDGFESTGKKIEELRQVVLSEMNKMGDGSLIVNGIDKYTEREKENFKNSNIIVAESKQDIIDFIKNYVKKGESKRLYLGKIGTDLANRIFKDTGIMLDGYNIAINSSFENSHSDENYEKSRGQVAMTPWIISNLLEMISDYKKVEIAGKTPQGKPALKFYTEFNGRQEIIEYVQDKKHTINLQTIYGWENKKDSHPVTNAKASAITSETNWDMNQFNEIIAENSENATQGKHNKKSFLVDVNSESLDANEIARKAKEYFGTTDNWNEAGYITITGDVLNFSEGYGYRDKDHRDISEVLVDYEGTEALIEFMNQGNIRIQPESNGIDIAVRPNDIQIKALRSYFNELNGEVLVDFSNTNGKPAGSSQYKQGTSSARILKDIDSFFDTGEIPEGTSDGNIYYSIDVNSDGEKLTPEQVEYFKDSVVRDESGKLMVMYHGTPNATFTVFRPNSFFTEDKSYADVYQNVGASSDSVKTTADNPDTYKVYLNIKKPFDTRNPEVKKIWDEQYYHKWDTGELMESGLPDWNAASGLIDFIEENELDFDGLILDEGGVGGYGDEVKSRGLSYVVFHPSQVKNVTNENPTDNSDIRYSVDIDDELSIFASVMEENEQLKEASNVIKNTVQNIANLKIKSSDIRKIASDIKNEYKINTSVEDIAEALANVFNYMQQDNVNYDALVQIMGEIAKPMLENATTTTSTRSEAWDAFRSYLSGTRFKLSNKQAREVISAYGSTENYRKALFGVVTVSKDAEMTLDEMWSELVDASGNTLPAYVSDTDQPAVLMETINGLRPQSEKTNTYGMNLESASYDLALDIYRRFFESQARQNMNAEINKAVGLVKAKQLEYRRKSLEQYKEKLAQQKILLEAEKKKNIKALAEEIKNADVDLQQALSENNDVAAAIIEDLKNKNAKKIEQIKKQKDKDIAEIKARNFDARKNERDRRKNAALKEQLKNQTNALNKMLKSPNTANFVKPSLVKGTIDVLESINLDTGKSQGMRDKLARLSEMYAAYKSDSTFNFDYDENTHAMILELRDTFKDRNYTELSNDELKRVVDLVIRLKTQIQNASKLLRNEQYSDAAKCATAVIGEVNDSKGSLDNAFTKKLDNYLSYQLNAYRWFRKTSGYKDDGALMNIYNQLDRGQLDMIRMQKEINDMFAPLLFGKENQENIKRLSSIEDKDMVDIGMKVDGKPVKVTRGMLLSYLMHVQNDGNARHMVLGGFTVPDMKAYKDGKYSTAYEKTVIGQFFTLDDIKQATENIKYSKKDAGLDDGVKVAVKLLQGRAKKLRNNLSEWELSYLETAEKLFHEYYGQKINEVSVETKGYALAQVKNYYPIRTDKKFTRTEFAALKQDGSLEGMGFLKERIKASNPIMLEDITQVILRQTDNTSRYVGFSIPVRNVNMVMNMKFNNKTSPESAISSKWGEQNLKLFQKIMQDIQTGRGVDEGLGKVFTALRGNFAAATLTANVGVGMKQAASYPTAAAVLGWKPLAKAFKDIPKGVTSKGIPELEAINPLLWYRSQGQSSADINYAKQSDVYKFLDNKAPALKAVSVDLIQNIDSATVRTLEYASMYYVDEQYKDLQKGTEEYWSKVSDVFTKVVEETQPNYTVLQRPEVLKDTNALVRQLFMFKTQPMQNLGILYDAIGEFSTVKKKYNKSSAEYKASADKVARAVSSQLVAALVFSAMTILSNVIYHKLWKYDQDEDKSFVEEALVALMDGVAGTLSGMLICGDWIYNATKELLFGAKNYGVEVSIVENFNNTVSMMNKYKEYSVKLAEAKTEAQRADAITKLLRNTEDLAVSIGQYFGIPVNNLKNTLTAPYLYIKDIATGNQIGSSNLFWDETPESQKMRMYEALLDGNMERYQKLFDEQVQASDATDPEQSIHNQIKNMLHDAYLEKEIGPEQVLKYLDDAGIEYKDDILDEWDYKYETGATSYSKYSRMNDAIGLVMQNDTSDNRKAMTEEIKKLVSSGVEKSNIGSNLTSKYKQQYLELKKKGNAASMKNILVTCYMAAGYTREEATKRIDNWK